MLVRMFFMEGEKGYGGWLKGFIIISFFIWENKNNNV